MPLFFFMSGLFTPPILTKSSMKGYMFKRTKRLLIPYIFTGFLMILARGYYGYWFLFSLWETSLLAILPITLSLFFNKKDSILRDVIIYGIVYFILRYFLKIVPANSFAEFDRCLFSLPCFFLGIIIGKYSLLDKLNSTTFTFLLFIFIASYVIRYVPFIVNSQWILKTVEKVTGWITPIAGTLFVVNLFKIGVSQTTGKWLSLLGRNSLQIYILHVFFVIQLPAIGQFILYQKGMTCVLLQFVYSFIITSIAITLSLLTARVLQRSPLLNSMFFGN